MNASWTLLERWAVFPQDPLLQTASLRNFQSFCRLQLQTSRVAGMPHRKILPLPYFRRNSRTEGQLLRVDKTRRPQLREQLHRSVAALLPLYLFKQTPRSTRHITICLKYLAELLKEKSFSRFAHSCYHSYLPKETCNQLAGSISHHGWVCSQLDEGDMEWEELRRPRTAPVSREVQALGPRTRCLSRTGAYCWKGWSTFRAL